VVPVGATDTERTPHDVIIVCTEVCHCNSSDFSSELENVMRRCAINRLFGQMRALTKIIERFGGKTELTEAPTETESGRTNE